MRRRFATLAVCALLMAGLAGCDRWNPWADPEPTVTTTATAPAETAPPTATPTQSPPADSTPLGPLSGIWDGTWANTSPVPGDGTFTLIWGQQGGKLVGSIEIVGSNCLSVGSVDGTIVGDRLRFGALEGAVTVTFEGTVTAANTLSGTYRSDDCGTSGAQGTWSATRRQS